MTWIAKKIAERLGLADAIRWSLLYRLFRNPFLFQEQAREVSFLRPWVPPGSVCFDIGAHVGSKTEIFLKLRARKVIAVEPDPACVRILRMRFGTNPRVQILPVAVGNTTGEKPFYLSENNRLFNTLSPRWARIVENPGNIRIGEGARFRIGRTKTVTLDSLIHQQGVPHLIKLDVEGYELQALHGLNRRIPVVWFECNLPEFLRETLSCIRRIRRLDSRARFNCANKPPNDPGIRWMLPRWVDHSEISRWVRSTGDRFVEIYARMPTDSEGPAAVTPGSVKFFL